MRAFPNPADITAENPVLYWGLQWRLELCPGCVLPFYTLTEEAVASSNKARIKLKIDCGCT